MRKLVELFLHLYRQAVIKVTKPVGGGIAMTFTLSPPSVFRKNITRMHLLDSITQPFSFLHIQNFHVNDKNLPIKTF